MNEIPDLRADAILITGPTASGKSALALRLAERYGGEVINADSMQVYDTLEVLTARPSRAETGEIPHHLYGTVPASESWSTGKWLRSVVPIIADIRHRGHLPIVVGGTGLYFRALTGGLSEMPAVDPALRQELRGRLASRGAEAMYLELRGLDPQSADTLSPTDGQRILRALEIVIATGQSIRSFQLKAGEAVLNEQGALKIIVEPERPILHQRINRRFDQMMNEGAIEEVRALLALDLDPSLPVMKAIGVSQIAAMIAGRLSRADAIEQASAATRQYAKRQSTWFRNQLGEDWRRISSAEDAFSA